MQFKIISGGQTGADRAALDAGIESGIPVGGSCPSGRLAEDGPIDPGYPLDEIAGGYEARTKKNVERSDATVIFFKGSPEGGTAKTVAFCKVLGKQHRLFDIDQLGIEDAAAEIVSFVSGCRILVLNVAGPRQSTCPAIYPFVKETMLLVAAELKRHGNDFNKRIYPDCL